MAAHPGGKYGRGAWPRAGVLYAAGDQRLAIELVLGLLTLWFVVETIKAIADRARPFALLADVRVIGWRALGRSFPSGHTAQAFFIAALLAHHFQIMPVAAAGLYGLAALVGITRIYVGAHYPRDVVAGGLLGTVWGIFAILVDPYLWLLPGVRPDSRPGLDGYSRRGAGSSRRGWLRGHRRDGDDLSLIVKHASRFSRGSTSPTFIPRLTRGPS